jgi:hypothetical protein
MLPCPRVGPIRRIRFHYQFFFIVEFSSLAVNSLAEVMLLTWAGVSSSPQPIMRFSTGPGAQAFDGFGTNSECGPLHLSEMAAWSQADREFL